MVGQAVLCRTNNVMGSAKAALEASVGIGRRFGSQAYPLSLALSAGPVRPLAGAGIADARFDVCFQEETGPLRARQ